MMNRAEAEDFVYKSYLKAEKYQDYHVRDSAKRRPGLTREIIRQKAGTPCAVVTGSKGKGSVSVMISQILQSQYTVGLMTSPHLIDFCERFKVNGINISAVEFTEYMSLIKEEIDRIDAQIPEDVCVSPMGIQAVLGLSYFNARHTDFNVFECGKGAQYDDVNNIKHDYAVINSIFLEHTRELGETLEDIAADKAHVITGEQKCVYVAEQKPGAMEVIGRRAKKFRVPLKIYGRDFWAENITYSNQGMKFDVVIGDIKYTNIIVPLLGEHQAENCALAMALCKDVLGEVDIVAAREKLSETEWPGRMEVISADPFMMLDACINSASCRNVKDVLSHLHIEEATVIIGIPNDKDYAGVIREMNAVAGKILLTESQNPHYIFTDEQCAVMEKENIQTVWTNSVEAAIDKAKELEKPVIILGTTSVVAEVKKLQLSHVI